MKFSTIRRTSRWFMHRIASTGGDKVFVVLGLAAMCERPVLAYIDPGSGSLIYQVILAVVLGVGFTFRRALGAIGRLWRRATPSSDHRAPPPSH